MKRLLENFQAKLICFLLAWGLWFYTTHLRHTIVYPEEPPLSVLQITEVPLRLEGTHAAHLKVDPPSVQLTLRWSPQDPVSYAALQQIYAVVRAEAADTIRNYRLTPQDFVLPPGWLLEEITPRQVTLIPILPTDKEF